MSEDKQYQLFKVAKELNIGLSTAVDHLSKIGYKVDSKPTAKINGEMYSVLQKEFELGKIIKEEAKHVQVGKPRREEASVDVPLAVIKPQAKEDPKETAVKNTLANTSFVKKNQEEENTPPPAAAPESVKAEAEDNRGFKVVGKIDLDALSHKKKAVKKAPAAEEKIVSMKKVESAKEVVEVPVEKPVLDQPVAEIPVKKEAPNPAPTPIVEEKPVPETKPVELPKPEVLVKQETAKPEKDSVVVLPEEKSVQPSAPITQTVPLETKIEAPVASTPEEPKGDDVIRAKAQRLSGPNIIGKIELPVERRAQPVASSAENDRNKRKRKRKEGPGGVTPGAQAVPGQQTPRPPYQGQGQGVGQGGRPTGHVGGSGNATQRPPHVAGQPKPPGSARPQYNRPTTGAGGGGGGRFQGNRPDSRGPLGTRPVKEELDDKKVQEQIKQTLAKLTGAGRGNKLAAGRKHRRQKRDDYATNRDEMMQQSELESKILQATEFVTANELASMMDVPVTKVIGTCMSLGMFVSINQRLDAETITIVADEFGYSVEFVSADVQEEVEDDVDDPAEMVERPPIVTVMGHVDHGKTSLLDFIRKANVIKGEAGGITQHVGAYEVKLENGKRIAFLDTPGHEAFTAMRARGAKVTDVVIIVIAADDAVMPQTIEAINHAQAAGVPIIFAFNKIDKPGANADKVREQLSAMNILVEEWGGKFQTQEISAKQGLNIDILLEKVLLERNY